MKVYSLEYKYEDETTYRFTGVVSTKLETAQRRVQMESDCSILWVKSDDPLIAGEYWEAVEYVEMIKGTEKRTWRIIELELI